eukprot:g13288.t1
MAGTGADYTGRLPTVSTLQAPNSPELQTDVLLAALDKIALHEESIASAVDVKDTYYRFFMIRFRDPQMQACYQAHKQSRNKKLFLYRVGFMALVCGPLWLVHLPQPQASLSPLFKLSYWAWLLMYELCLMFSMFSFLHHKRHPKDGRFSSLCFWLEQLGLIG